MAILCEKEKNGRREGEKESKKLIEFHHGLSVYPSLPPPYTHVGASTLCGGDAEGLRVYRCSRNTSTSMEKAGIRARVYVCVCVYFRVEPAAYLRRPLSM